MDDVTDQAVRLGVATCAAAPGSDEDAPLLLPALADAGLSASVHVWDDPSVDWPGFDAVLVRSTWDYPMRRDAFLAWARRCRRTANPVAVLEWNTDKAYLADLAARGIPTVPTVFLPPGAALRPPGADFVVKPSVSGSAADTGRFDDRTLDEAQALVSQLHAQGRTAMAQPYVEGIDRYGETSLVFLGAEFSHAVRRQPLLGDAGVRKPVVVADVLSTVSAVDPTPDELDVAQRALDAVPGGRDRLAYARVDLVPGESGAQVLELEATDCYLFLGFARPAGIRRLVDAAHRAATAPS